MNPFAGLQNDTVYIENSGSDRTGPYKTDIGAKGSLSATIFGSTLDVEEGWQLFRTLPNGKEESYTILETNYNAGLHTIPPSWNLKLRKDSSLISRQPSQKKTTINISNSQGIQVGDHNTQTIESGLNELIQTITSSDSSAPEKEEALGTVKSLLNNPMFGETIL
jgi:hypothetical protein